jgi:Helix-turn-helix domain of resolvase
VQFGRKPRLTQHQQAEGRRRLENGESAMSIARDFNCHHASLHGYARPEPHDRSAVDLTLGQPVANVVHARQARTAMARCPFPE